MTSDGKKVWLVNYCPYCQLDTAGCHEIDCPLNPDQFYVIKVLAPCPYAEWTIWCYDGTDKCERCPVRKTKAVRC